MPIENITPQAAQIANKYIAMTPSSTPSLPEAKSDTVDISQASTPEGKNEIPEELKSRKKSKNNLIATLCLSAAGLITVLGFVTNAKGWNKKLNKLLQDAIGKIKGSSGGEALNMTRLKGTLKDGTKNEKVMKMANFMNNGANFKDCYIMPILEKIPGLRTFASKTSDVYRKTGISMTQGKYKGTQNTYKAFDEAIHKGVGAIEDSSIADQVKKLLQKRNSALGETFDPSKVSKIVEGVETGRIKMMDEMMNEGKGICIEVRDTFSDLITRLFKSKGKDREGFGHFVAEDLLKDKKAAYIEPLKAVRDQITQIDDEIIELIKNTGGDKFSAQQLEELTKAKTSAAKSLNNAIRTEANDLLDKLRDIKIGCAPTDIMGIGASAGLLGIYMAQAETKDQKVDVALTTGIPLGLGMAATTFTTMKMYTGLKPLLVGAATTFIANTAGKFLSKKYKKAHNVEDKKPDIPTLENTVGELNKKVVKEVKKHTESKKA